ncbi:urea ABC transporter permease subunit UrtB, partial [Litoricolaceae bacterium]|nr:urea ABC transporter permease subunit UrtB [Litorivicinaceae bacterium]
MDIFLSQLFTGLSIASILLVIALGLSIIYGTTGVINLAHGEFVMLGAYMSWFLQTFLGISLIPAIPLILIGMFGLGWLIERTVIRTLYSRPLDTILATWGIGILAQQLIRLSAGGELRYVELPAALNESIEIMGASVSLYRLFILGVALLLFAVTWFLFNKTRFGQKIRALTQNSYMAESFGINKGQVYSLTFAYGAALAGIAGALVSPLKSVSPEMGTGYVVDAFMVVVMGGVDSLIGTVASSFLIGQMSGVFAYLSNDTLAKAL